MVLCFYWYYLNFLLINVSSENMTSLWFSWCRWHVGAAISVCLRAWSGPLAGPCLLQPLVFSRFGYLITIRSRKLSMVAQTPKLELSPSHFSIELNTQSPNPATILVHQEIKECIVKFCQTSWICLLTLYENFEDAWRCCQL